MKKITFKHNKKQKLITLLALLVVLFGFGAYAFAEKLTSSENEKPTAANETSAGQPFLFAGPTPEAEDIATVANQEESEAVNKPTESDGPAEALQNPSQSQPEPTVSSSTAPPRTPGSTNTSAPAAQNRWPEPVTGENSLNNNSNNQLFTKSGDWLYYYDHVKKSLLKIKTDGTAKTVVKKDVEVFSIAMSGDYIYYSAAASTGYNKNFGVFRIKTDGTDNRKVSVWFTSDEYYSSLNIYNENHYYMTQHGVEEIKLDHSAGKILPMQPTLPRDMYIWNGTMYYTNYHDRDSIYKMPLGGGQPKIKLNTAASSHLNFYNGHVYFSNTDDNGKIYRTDDTGGIVKIGDDKVYSMNVYNGYIYYTNANDDNKLYKVKVDGTGKTKLTEEPAFNLNIVGNWVYCTNYKENKIYVVKNDGSRKYGL